MTKTFHWFYKKWLGKNVLFKIFLYFCNPAKKNIKT